MIELHAAISEKDRAKEEKKEEKRVSKNSRKDAENARWQCSNTTSMSVFLYSSRSTLIALQTIDLLQICASGASAMAAVRADAWLVR